MRKTIKNQIMKKPLFALAIIAFGIGIAIYTNAGGFKEGNETMGAGTASAPAASAPAAAAPAAAAPAAAPAQDKPAAKSAGGMDLSAISSIIDKNPELKSIVDNFTNSIIVEPFNGSGRM